MSPTLTIILLVLGGIVVAGMLFFIIAHFLSPIHPRQPREPQRTEPSPAARAGESGGSLCKLAPVLDIRSSSIVLQTTNDVQQCEVNGVKYSSVDEIPDPQVREQIRALIQQLPPTGAVEYKRVEDIPDSDLRRRIEEVLKKTLPADSVEFGALTKEGSFEVKLRTNFLSPSGEVLEGAGEISVANVDGKAKIVVNGQSACWDDAGQQAEA
jgi:hypothetical protein